MSQEEKICFVIAPIGQEGSETRKRSDQILRHVIRPAAEECGYRAVRADEISDPGLIAHQVITHIMNDPIVVADLTGWNPDVFYELALRHAVRRPFVQLFQPMPQKERMPFDVVGLRAVDLNWPDWDSMEESRDRLVEAIKAAEQMDPAELTTPVSFAVDLRKLSGSKDPTVSALAELTTLIAQLDARVSSIEQMREVEQRPKQYPKPGRRLPEDVRAEIEELARWERERLIELASK